MNHNKMHGQQNIKKSLLVLHFEFRAGMVFTVFASPVTEFTDILLHYDMLVEFRCC